MQGFKDIIAGKGKSLAASPWTVSDNDGQMYFFDVAATGEDYGHSIDDELEDAINVTCNQSFEAARLQYAVNGQGGQVVVLVCDIPDDMLELDYSCHGDSDAMPNARAVPCCDFDLKWIVDIKVGAFDQWDCVAALACVWGNQLFNHGAVPEKLAALVDNVAGNCDGLYDSLYDYELVSVQNVSEFIQANLK
jgi:hypothetical protein